MNPYEQPPNYNPYQAPETMSQMDYQDDEMGLLDEPNRLPAGNGIAWVKESWEIFKARPLLWLAIVIFYVVVLSVLVFMPFIGFLVSFLPFFFIAGVAYIAYQVDVGEDTGFGDLFIAFRQSVGQQVMLCLVLFLIGIVMAFVLGLGISLMGLGVGLEGSTQVFNSMSTGVMLMVLAMMALMIPLTMAMWLAPILILFHELRATEAMKLSFKACWHNILPMLVFSVVMFILYVIASIPFGLGLLILMPMGMISSYVVYKDTLIGKVEY